jgi:large subunit ribosomal protein L20
MPRVKRGVVSRQRRKKVLKLAKGFRGASGNLYRVATESVDRALNYAYRDRRVKKREFRKLWIARINAAVRANNINYSQFIFGLKKANIDVDRKILSELAINNPENFSELVNIAKEQISLNTEASASC